MTRLLAGILIFLGPMIHGCLTGLDDPFSGIRFPSGPGDRLFVYQGAYDSLGTVEEIIDLVAQYDYVVVTHGFYLNGGIWRNGHCLDVGYTKMPELLAGIRRKNPWVKIFAYVPATADHPNGCWPQPSIQMPKCPDGSCIDFRRWTDLWLSLENATIRIDGIFVDLVHPALIGPAVRDSVFSYVRSRGKLIMANALSDTLGLLFTGASPVLRDEDIVLVEGYSHIAGSRNTQTERINSILRTMNVRWAALASEWYGTPISCGSLAQKRAYDLFRRNGGTAFAYQAADLGTVTGTWVFCEEDQ